MFHRDPQVLQAGEPLAIANSVGDRVITKSWLDELKLLLLKRGIRRISSRYIILHRAVSQRMELDKQFVERAQAAFFHLRVTGGVA